MCLIIMLYFPMVESVKYIKKILLLINAVSLCRAVFRFVFYACRACVVVFMPLYVVSCFDYCVLSVRLLCCAVYDVLPCCFIDLRGVIYMLSAYPTVG